MRSSAASGRLNAQRARRARGPARPQPVKRRCCCRSATSERPMKTRRRISARRPRGPGRAPERGQPFMKLTNKSSPKISAKKISAGGRGHESNNQNYVRPSDIRMELLSLLTARERQIMNLVSGGLSNKQIARHLKLTDGTIKVHLHHMFDKLGISNRTSLAALAIRQEARE